MGDSLDDGFEEYEMEQDEEEDIDGDDDVPLDPDGGKESKKRKHKEEGGEADAGNDDAQKKAKKEKNKQKKKDKKEAAEDGDGTAALPFSSPQASTTSSKKIAETEIEPQQLLVEKQAEYVWSRYSQLMELSPLERDLSFIDAKQMVGVNRKKLKQVKKHKPPQQQQQQQQGDKEGQVTMTGLTEFLKLALPSLGSLASEKSMRVPGSPFAIIISSSAVRSNDLAKELRVTLKSYKTAKLFAKHMKVKEQVELLKEYQPLACGTPHRLSHLIDIGALSLSATRLIILDMAKDSKNYHLLNLPGTAQETSSFLKAHIFPQLSKADSRLKIALF